MIYSIQNLNVSKAGIGDAICLHAECYTGDPL
jgi:hypothetical protein